MAQTSRFWVTSATPSGDQQASYSGADFADVWRAMGEGVISGHSLPALDGELACSAGGLNTVNVADGAAIVDGIYFESTAVENVNVPSAVGAGNTRIDRIVVRVNWGSYEAAITRIAGTDAATPSAPSITQTTETTYDLPLCQVLVDTSGNVTVTDERTWAMPKVDGSTIEVDQATGALQVPDEGITNAKTSFFNQDSDAEIYFGRISYTGPPDAYSAVKLPSDWSVAVSGAATARITHNLGSSAYIVIAQHEGAGVASFCVLLGRATNYFDITTYLHDGTALGDNFDFILITY